jgi:energy-coupling factor transporter ATP-binding protein EcfA2
MTAEDAENTYRPPEDLWDMDASLQFNEALDQDDPRYVATDEARGDYSVRNLLRTLGVDDRDSIHLSLRTRHPRLYCVFCGHRGCGKSTELRRLAQRLNKPETFFVVFLDALRELDPNNLTYADVLLALSKELFETLDRKEIHVDDILLKNLQAWFYDRVETDTKTKQYATELKAGAKAKTGIPFLAELFGGLTTALKSNSSYKDELRRIVENSFSQFADSFNQCITAAEDAVERAGKGRKILFIVDGTDRLRDKDRERFFVGDVHQLKQIQSNFIYCAPISLLYESNQVQQDFNNFILPMIKLREKGSDEPLPAGYSVMKQMVYKRAHPKLFETPELVDELICYSGGSPRELFKLMHYAFLRASKDCLDPKAVAGAVHDLATDYKRIIDTEDYPLLKEIDQSNDMERNSERIRHFLYHLIVLEYNGFWRQTHPVVQTLPGYADHADPI